MPATRRSKRRALFTYLGLSAFASALVPTTPEAPAAEPRLELSLPVECKLNKDCWVQNYVDRDPGPGMADHRCGQLSYDGHKGTDFRLSDYGAMRRGVRVVAAAAGRVKGMRDGVTDRIGGPRGAEVFKGKECGNGVVLDHGGGWQTQYCHMRRGSVSVRRGQTVSASQPLGLIGMSGDTQFPHLHLSVRHKGKVIDPFDGRRSGEKSLCGLDAKPLWRQPIRAALKYRESGLLRSGFATRAPTMAEILNGDFAATAYPRTVTTLFFWVLGYGLRSEDIEEFLVVDPSGEAILFGKRPPAPKRKAQWFTYAGKPSKAKGWRPGRYKARYRLLRRPIGGGSRRVVFEVRKSLVLR